jgi:hypothetical protein
MARRAQEQGGTGFSTLELVDVARPDGERGPVRRFREYIVNGRPLARWIGREGAISPFGWLQRRDEAWFARLLLGELGSPLASGRVPLYVCGQCADLGCGAVTVALIRTPESYIWKDFGSESHHDLGEEPIATFAEGFEFHFDRTRYATAFRAFR